MSKCCLTVCLSSSVSFLSIYDFFVLVFVSLSLSLHICPFFLLPTLLCNKSLFCLSVSKCCLSVSVFVCLFGFIFLFSLYLWLLCARVSISLSLSLSLYVPLSVFFFYQLFYATSLRFIFLCHSVSVFVCLGSSFCFLSIYDFLVLVLVYISLALSLSVPISVFLFYPIFSLFRLICANGCICLSTHLFSLFLTSPVCSRPLLIFFCHFARLSTASFFTSRIRQLHPFFNSNFFLSVSSKILLPKRFPGVQDLVF